MTLERASELVGALRETHPDKATQLFQHFASILTFRNADDVEMFVRMCGYGAKRKNPPG